MYFNYFILITCSVINTERFLYFLLIFVPNVIKRNINIPREKLQNNASTLYRECKLSRSYITNINIILIEYFMYICIFSL